MPELHSGLADVVVYKLEEDIDGSIDVATNLWTAVREIEDFRATHLTQFATLGACLCGVGLIDKQHRGSMLACFVEQELSEAIVCERVEL